LNKDLFYDRAGLWSIACNFEKQLENYKNMWKELKGFLENWKGKAKYLGAEDHFETLDIVLLRIVELEKKHLRDEE